MRTLFVILVIVFTHSLGICFDKPVFAVRPENIDFLRYFIFQNNFEFAGVVYKFGEVVLEHDDSHQFVCLKHSMDTLEYKKMTGLPVKGIKFDLQDLAGSESFQIPESGQSEIKFFRTIKESWNYYNISNRKVKGDKPDKKQIGILERTEFVLQCISSKTGEILATLDSVVSIPNDDPGATSPLGTNPKLVFHHWKIPQSLNGKEVYLRISPRSWGERTTNLSLEEFSNWANFGCLLDSTGELLGYKNKERLDSISWKEIQFYVDSTIKETGDLPFHNLNIPPAFYADFNEKYRKKYMQVEINKGDTVYTRSKSLTRKSNINRYDKYINKVFIVILNNIVQNCKLKLKVNSGQFTFCIIELRSKKNPSLKKEWKGKMLKGENSVNLDVLDLPEGEYDITIDDRVYHQISAGFGVITIKK